MSAIPSETIVYEAEIAPVVIVAEEIEETPITDIESLIRAKFHEQPELAVAIAKCESGLNPDAYNDRNTNGSVDRGLLQLNSIHDPALARLGLDPWDVEDNLEFGRILYDNRGGRFDDWVCYTHNLLAQA